MIENYLALEPLIAARLKERVPELRAVLGAPEYAAIEAVAPPTPCAFVVYVGDLIESQGSGEVVAQRWGVVLAVSNVSDQASGEAKRAEAGRLLEPALKALTNWRASPDFRPLRRVQAPPPTYTQAVGYFPLAFEAGLIMVGTLEDEE